MSKNIVNQSNSLPKTPLIDEDWTKLASKQSNANNQNKTHKKTNSNISNSVSNKVGKSKRKFLLVTGLILVFSTVSFAQIIVHDPQHMRSNILSFAKELAQHVTHLNYITEMNGRWMSKLEIIDKIETIAASKGIPIDQLGWDRVRFAKDQATQLSADALDDLNKIVEGKAKASDLGSLQRDLEQIYRPAPVTSAGAKSEHALREMASATAFVNQTQKSIEETQKNIDRLQKDIESGQLRPGDLERYQVLVASYQAQIQTLQTQANNQVIRQQVAQTGLMANEATIRENNRLKNRYEMFQAGKIIQFSPKLRKQSDEVGGVE